MTHSDIYATRYHWGIECAAIIGGYRVSRKYIGYNMRQARQKFYQDAKAGKL